MQIECALPRGTGKYEPEQQQYGDSAYSDPELLRDYIRVRLDAFRLPSNVGYVVRTELAQARKKPLSNLCDCRLPFSFSGRVGGFNPQALRDMLGRF